MRNLIMSVLAGTCLATFSQCKKPLNIPVTSDSMTLQKASGLKIGAAIDVSLLQYNSAYRNTLLLEHSSITTENALKWPDVHPENNRFDFTNGDYIQSFCSLNNKRLHGHCLIWYQSNPVWLVNYSGDSLSWENLFKIHIQTVVSHYKGKASSWDVVNEAFHDEDGSLRVKNLGTGGNNFDDGSIWARHLGRDYIARAYIYAHQADSSALLFYNDYGQEYFDKKTDSIIGMVNDFKSRHIPIHGLGIQMHIDIYLPNSGIVKAFQKLAATGLLIHISELDIRVNPNNNPSFTFSNELSQMQSDKYAFIVQQYRSLVPAAQQYGITTWNVGDSDSWIRSYLKAQDWPLLFDDKYSRKTAYFGFREALLK